MESTQQSFHRRWGHLRERCVRDLAWLLDAPDMLDPAAQQWSGKVATLDADAAQRARGWLERLDAEPQSLYAYLDIPRTPRVGRYAEKLLAFYFKEHSLLAAHSLQVRSQPGATLGEFDFLLASSSGATQLDHRELAVKFYLLAADFRDAGADYFMGPNLADSLEEKMRKILGRQLELASHPAAQSVLPGTVSSAQAFVKGWLFWPGDAKPTLEACHRAGISPTHCRGRWMTQAEWLPEAGCGYQILPRLHWLAPAQISSAEVQDASALQSTLDAHFQCDKLPVLVAALAPSDDALHRECDRFFVVPPDWRDRALRATGCTANSSSGAA